MTVPAPLVRLSEGFCPISTHGRLTESDDVVWDGYREITSGTRAHCTQCDAAWHQMFAVDRLYVFHNRPDGISGYGIDNMLLHVLSTSVDDALLDIVAHIGGTPRT